jgi:3-hydroxyisobutyrate dehydrogenase-like beta-hydroxyacid dehydrogenase
MKPVVGFIGLGYMGLPMADRILSAGYDLVVWNRNAAKADSLIQRGARLAADPVAVAADCDMVFTCLADDAALEQVVLGPRGVGSAPGRARLLIDASTVDPRRIRAMAAQLAECGPMRWVDAPVSGGPAGARAGALATMAGGEDADVEAMRPVAMTYSARLAHMGPLGSGQAAKACNQIMFFGGVLAIAEAFALGQQLGLDIQRLPEALAGGFADSGVLREYGRAKAAGERGAIPALVEGLAAVHGGVVSDRFRGKLGMSVKDVGIVRALGQGETIDMPAMELAARLLKVLHDDKAT